MAVDFENFPADPGNDNNEDSEMLPCKPNPPSTPECKGTQAALDSASSQKDPLPTRKIDREEQRAGSPDKENPGAETPPLDRMDNLVTSTLAPVAIQECPPPRHQTLSPLFLHHLQVSRTGSGLALEIL